MATRKQKVARQRRATQHARRAKPELPSVLTGDDRWLGWSRDHGLDLQRREQLLDSVAVGLSVVLAQRNLSRSVRQGLVTLFV